MAEHEPETVELPAFLALDLGGELRATALGSGPLVLQSGAQQLVGKRRIVARRLCERSQVKGPALGLVGLEQAGSAPSSHDGSELPAEVGCVAQPLVLPVGPHRT